MIARALAAFSRSIQNVPMLDEFMQQARKGRQLATQSGLGGRRFFLQTYGCQMNEADSQLVLTQMKQQHQEVGRVEEAEIVLINTCAIREGAENKVIQRIRQLRKDRKVAILGCMGERLKGRLQGEGVSLVVGPDSYRDIGKLVEEAVRDDHFRAETFLSEEETYSDIEQTPLDPSSVQSFLPIMRGCNNMCSFCIVPFTRGRERSRDFQSIIAQVQKDVSRGVREVTLLGQNVNSYFVSGEGQSEHENSNGFAQMYKLRGGKGYRFADLLQSLAREFPQTRFKFTSPHPKDFPLKLLETIAKHPNLVKSIHLPAQSGSSSVLSRMRRNHTREAYLQLVARIRATIPGVTLSSDFICGFCDESEAEFQQTISLMEQVKYEQAYMFAYSMRPRTHAYRNYEDSVPDAVKHERLARLIAKFRECEAGKNEAEPGRTHLVLITEQSVKDGSKWKGLTNTSKRVFVQKKTEAGEPISIGDFVEVLVQTQLPKSLYGVVKRKSSIREFSARAGKLPFIEK